MQAHDSGGAMKWVFPMAGLAAVALMMVLGLAGRRAANRHLRSVGCRVYGQIMEARHEGGKCRQTRVTYVFRPAGKKAEICARGLYEGHLPFQAGDRVEIVHLPAIPVISALVTHLDQRLG